MAEVEGTGPGGVSEGVGEGSGEALAVGVPVQWWRGDSASLWED